MIAIASDHAGFALKEKLKLHFKENNIRSSRVIIPFLPKNFAKKFRTANVTKVFSSAERASA